MAYLRLDYHSARQYSPLDSMLFLISIFTLNGLSVSYGQSLITVTSPLNHQVVQRDSSGFATISLTGYIHYPFSRLEARLTPIGQNPYPAVTTTLESAQTSQGFFSKPIVARSGWYTLTFLGYSSSGSVDSLSVDRVGVGEVFLIAGNSNAMGLPDLGAKDGSENVISFNTVNKILNQENITVAADAPMAAPVFSPIDSKNYLYPSGETSWYWGELGEMLFQKSGVPVLFLNASWAAANSENYRDGALGKDAYNLYVDKYWPNRQPYSNIKNTLRYFNSWLGIRAVLWAHGENDAQLGFTENVYFDNIRTLVEKSRTDAGFSAPWIMARSSAGATIMQPYQPIINAQNRFFAEKSWNIYPGPDLDRIQIPRPGHGHFENVPGGVQGLTDAAKAWNAILTDSFLAEIKPLQPAYSIHTGVTPLEVRPGDPFLLPYRMTGNAATNLAVHAELLDDQNKYIATVALGNQSPLTVTLPQTLENGTYKIRVTGSSPIIPGSISDRFYVHKNLPGNQYVSHIFSRREDNNIHVSWLVSANGLTNRIILQKTTNGLSYTDIANLQVTDNRNTSHLYAYTDQETTIGNVFYRVALELADGTTTTSSISPVFGEGNTPYLLAFPNPVVDQTFRFRIDPGQEILECKLYDVKGREFGLNTNEKEMSGAVTARPTIQVPSGNYILQVITNRGSASQSILVL